MPHSEQLPHSDADVAAGTSSQDHRSAADMSRQNESQMTFERDAVLTYTSYRYFLEPVDNRAKPYALPCLSHMPRPTTTPKSSVTRYGTGDGNEAIQVAQLDRMSVSAVTTGVVL